MYDTEKVHMVDNVEVTSSYRQGRCAEKMLVRKQCLLRHARYCLAFLRRDKFDSPAEKTYTGGAIPSP